MPRAAPGDVAREAHRRKFPEYLPVPACNLGEYSVIYPYRLGMGNISHPYGSRFGKWCYFTQQFSGFEVERGRLGEVVSLVGDCRPPPPGNPHRLTPHNFIDEWWDGWQMSRARADMGSNIISSKVSNFGTNILTVWKHYSFNNPQFTHNLKELNKLQYFKNNRSYSSCVVKKHVLEFSHFHSHLCGLREVEPPSIAITNVLET